MEVENVDNNQCGTIQRDYFEVIARLIYGTLMGTGIDIEGRLAFSVLENVRPMIETVPLAQATDAYAADDGREGAVSDRISHRPVNGNASPVPNSGVMLRAEVG
jgi:D-arabinose 1-dehydrogenase-like Zn-dependent alcohol dehydrogenase